MVAQPVSFPGVSVINEMGQLINVPALHQRHQEEQDCNPKPLLVGDHIACGNCGEVMMTLRTTRS